MKLKKLELRMENFMVEQAELRMRCPGGGGIDENVDLIVKIAKEAGYGLDRAVIREKLIARAASMVIKDILPHIKFPKSTKMQ